MDKKLYDIADICVACGKPSPPGDMLCWECRKNANDAGNQWVQQAEEAALDAVNAGNPSRSHAGKIRNWLENKFQAVPGSEDHG